MSDKLLEQLQLKKSTKEPVEEFLKSQGYKSSSCPITKEFMSKPDFYAKRDENTIAVFELNKKNILNKWLKCLSNILKIQAYALKILKQNKQMTMNLICTDIIKMSNVMILMAVQ